MQARVSLPVRITATAVVMNAPGYITGIFVKPDGTNAITLTLRDNAASGAGTYLCPVLVVAGTGACLYYPLPNVWCKAGIHATVAVAGGGACDAVIYCKKR